MDAFTMELIGYVAVFGIGALVGATELMSRYPDSPFRAIRNWFGFSYLLANACGAIMALYVIHEFEWDFGLDSNQGARVQLVQWLAAAFGAMSILRSSLFNVRLGENDLGVGPAAILQVLLSAADRQVDRMRAEERSTAVKNAMRGIDSYAQIKIALPTHCMALMQNVSSDEEKRIRQVAENIEQLEVADCLKVLNLGLVLMNIVGDVVLRTAVTNVVQTQREAILEAQQQRVRELAREMALEVQHGDQSHSEGNSGGNNQSNYQGNNQPTGHSGAKTADGQSADNRSADGKPSPIKRPPGSRPARH